MKKLLIFALLISSTMAYSQDKNPVYKAEGDLVKATYFFDNGNIKTEGYFKNKKLTGEWVSYDVNGNKLRIAQYRDGKKVGKWIVWTKNGITEVLYKNNVISKINGVSSKSMVASNND